MVCPARLRVVVADDDDHWRYIIERTLRAEYDVIGYAERGDQVIGIACELQPDVITLDVSMPGQSGLAALIPLRAALPRAIIVMISTIPADLCQEAVARGADAYVPKSRVRSDLLSVLRAACSRALTSSDGEPDGTTRLNNSQ